MRYLQLVYALAVAGRARECEPVYFRRVATTDLLDTSSRAGD